MYRNVALLGLAALFLVGCNGGSDSSSTSTTTTPGKSAEATPSTGGAKLKIAFIPKGATHEFWKTMQAGANKAAEENNVELLWKAPLKEDDRAEQVKVVENFTTEKVDGIVLAPLDQDALVAPVKEAQDKKIPIVIVDSDLKDTKTVSFIATDNQAAGKSGGEGLAKAMGGKGKVILLRYQEGSASTMAREAGFLDAAKAAGLEVVSSDVYGGATRESAQTASENLIQRFKSGDGLSVQGIFCPNESTAFGMLKALQNAKLSGKVHFVGFDSSKELLDAIKAGELDGLMLQNPYKIGYEGVTNMVKAIKGEKVPDRIDTGAKFVTKENIDSDEVKAMLPK